MILSRYFSATYRLSLIILLSWFWLIASHIFFLISPETLLSNNASATNSSFKYYKWSLNFLSAFCETDESSFLQRSNYFNNCKSLFGAWISKGKVNYTLTYINMIKIQILRKLLISRFERESWSLNIKIFKL